MVLVMSSVFANSRAGTELEIPRLSCPCRAPAGHPAPGLCRRITRSALSAESRAITTVLTGVRYNRDAADGPVALISGGSNYANANSPVSSSAIFTLILPSRQLRESRREGGFDAATTAPGNAPSLGAPHGRQPKPEIQSANWSLSRVLQGCKTNHPAAVVTGYPAHER